MPDIGLVKIRVPQAVTRGQVVKIRCLVLHPMEVVRRDPAGKVIDQNYNFIHTAIATYNGKEIFRGETTQSISENPSFSFPLKATAPGTLKVTFEDTAGKKYEGAVEIKF